MITKNKPQKERHSAPVAPDSAILQDKPFKKKADENWRPQVRHLLIACHSIPKRMQRQPEKPDAQIHSINMKEKPIPKNNSFMGSVLVGR